MAKRTGAVAAAGATLVDLKAASAHPDLSSDVSSLQYSLNELEDYASFADVETDIENLDNSLNHALSLLESARDKGYKYQKDLEKIAYDAMSRWQKMREGLYADVEKQAASVQGSLNGVNAHINQLNGVLGNPASANSVLQSTQSEIDRTLRVLREAENKIGSRYSDIETKAYELTSRLTRIHWALAQLEEATFELEEGEDLVMGVAARWDAVGKEDPEGVLYLTNQRLIFERKEKVATKKVLFVTTASELVQKLMTSKPLAEIKSVKAHNKGLFGHQDFLDVEFSDKATGSVPFHLNGQDSEDWARLIQNAKSGKIEDDRATGSGLSFADLTGELSDANIVDLQNEINELQDEMMLKATHDELGQLETETSSLKRDLAGLRARGYAVEKSLEADIEVLAAQWERTKERAEGTLKLQTRLLGEQMNSIQKMMKELAGMSGNLSNSRPLYVQIKSAIASAEAQAEAAEQTVLDQYDEYGDENEALSAHMDWVDWMLDAIATASFKLLATESGVAAVEAAWERSGADPENGVLFLTDQRLLWEDRAGDYELKIDVALQQVEDVKLDADEEAGTDALEFKLGSGAPLPKARLELAQPVGEEWLQMVGRARSGDYSQDRAIEIDKAELDRIRNAPEICSNCNAALTAPVLRGQTEIVCEYCGVSTRI
jgi:hypothetical protein